jgi:hypothetical protein
MISAKKKRPATKYQWKITQEQCSARKSNDSRNKETPFETERMEYAERRKTGDLFSTDRSPPLGPEAGEAP